jgi:hypothetical protein
MPPIPPCTTTGLIDLCAPAPIYHFGIPWFSIQLPNLIWLGLVLLFVILCLFLPFPSKEVDFTGFEQPGERNELS